MAREITTPGLTAGSVYKLVCIASICFLVPFSLLMGFFALAGYGTVSWNGRYLTGVSGLIAAPFIGLSIALVATVVYGTMCVLGLWLYSIVVGPLKFTVKDG